MNTLAKSEPLDTLGLPPGDHLVRFHVEEDTISFELAATLTDPSNDESSNAALEFVRKWSGKGQVLADAETGRDARLAELTAKHLR